VVLVPSRKTASNVRRVDRYMFKEVMGKLDASGLPDELQDMVNPHHTGTPRRIAMTVLLTALILVFRWKGTATLAAVHDFLTTGLDRELQAELNIRDVPWGRHDDLGVLSYRQVQYLFKQIVRRVDPEAVEEGFERARRRNFLTRLQTEFARILIPEKDRTAVVEARAVDSTPIFGWFLSSSGVDEDSAWGERTKTDSDRREWFFGFRALTYCHATERPFVEAFSVRPGNKGEGPANTELATALASMLKKEGLELGKVLADRGFSELAVENWVAPMRNLGAELVFDYRAIDRGVVMILGALVSDGAPHCPCTPKELQQVQRPPRIGLGHPPGPRAEQRRKDQYKTDRENLEKAIALVERRDQYLGTHLSGSGYGFDVWQCPALAGKIRCKRRPDSLYLPDDRPYLDPGPEIEYGEFCKDASITLEPDVQPKLRQRFLWMSTRWRSWYRRRSYAEGVFGNIKNPATEAIGRGWIQLAGTIATTIMLWAAVSHYNYRIATGDLDEGDYGFVDLPRPDH
jgi:hypothetical protein